MSLRAELVLHANPSYELVLLDRLGQDERKLLDGEAELYGVFRPRAGADLAVRAASPDTALLFLTLRDPAQLPLYARAALGDDAERTIARLVLDGVLEVEHRRTFVSGPEAAELVLPGRSLGGGGRIGELSRAALAYAEALAGDGMGVAQLAARLYSYGRMPLTPGLSRRLADDGAIDVLLGIDSGGAARRVLDARWVAGHAAAGERMHWRSWRARDARAGAGARYKLYVSPVADALGTALQAAAGSCVAGRGPFAFKVGAGVDGLCRPDKLVVYFDRLDDLHETAALLRDELERCPAHGVPFTAAVTADGLLSWAADPPEQVDASWRSWVCERLAEYLVAATAGSARKPSEFALQRLRLAGVDTDAWIPQPGMWPRAVAYA